MSMVGRVFKKKAIFIFLIITISSSLLIGSNLSASANTGHIQDVSVELQDNVFLSVDEISSENSAVLPAYSEKVITDKDPISKVDNNAIVLDDKNNTALKKLEVQDIEGNKSVNIERPEINEVYKEVNIPNQKVAISKSDNIYTENGISYYISNDGNLNFDIDKDFYENPYGKVNLKGSIVLTKPVLDCELSFKNKIFKFILNSEIKSNTKLAGVAGKYFNKSFKLADIEQQFNYGKLRISIYANIDINGNIQIFTNTKGNIASKLGVKGNMDIKKLKLYNVELIKDITSKSFDVNPGFSGSCNALIGIRPKFELYLKGGYSLAEINLAGDIEANITDVNENGIFGKVDALVYSSIDALDNKYSYKLFEKRFNLYSK